VIKQFRDQSSACGFAHARESDLPVLDVIVGMQKSDIYEKTAGAIRVDVSDRNCPSAGRNRRHLAH